MAALVCFGLLLYAGLAHALDLRGFRRLIRSHSVWPASFAGVAAVATALFESAIGIAGLLTVFGMLDETAAAPLLGAAALTYMAYATYSAVLIRRGVPAPCGCSPGDEPVNGVTVARAVLLAICAIAAIVGGSSLHGLDDVDEAAVQILAGITFCVTLWCLPAALHETSGSDLAAVSDQLMLSSTEHGGR